MLNKYFTILNSVVCATKPSFPAACAHEAIPGLVNKLGDIKVKAALDDVLTTLAQHVGVNFVALRVMKEARGHRSPKVHADAVLWISTTLRDFGMLVATKPLLAFMREMMVRYGHANVRASTAVVKRAPFLTFCLVLASTLPEPDQPYGAQRWARRHGHALSFSRRFFAENAER